MNHLPDYLCLFSCVAVHVADSADNYAVIIAAGAVPRVVELVAKLPAAVLAAPAQLLAAMCRASSAAADQAIGVRMKEHKPSRTPQGISLHLACGLRQFMAIYGNLPEACEVLILLFEERVFTFTRGE